MPEHDVITRTLPAEEDTCALADRVAAALLAHVQNIARRGCCLRLTGDLGAGKTAFTRGLLRALGMRGRVRSPTFELVEEYELPCGLMFRHFDFYRFKSPEEFEEAGFRDLFGPGVVTACEWSNRAGRYLPPADLELILAVSGTGRIAELAARSDFGAVLLREVSAACRAAAT